MKILGVETFGICGVPDGHYDFEKAPGEAHDLVVIAGESATGKTRLLELIVAARDALAPSDGGVDQIQWIRDGNHTAKVVVTWLLSSEELRLIGASEPVQPTELIFGSAEIARGVAPSLVYLFERYDHDDSTPKVEYFAENRRLEVGGGERATSVEERARLRASKSPRKYAFVPTFLRQLGREPKLGARFAETLTRLSTSCRYDLDAGSFISNGSVVRSLEELSASEADAVLLAATATMLGLSHSIVLVDRPELYREPARVLDSLLHLGVGNQLVLATAYPELAGATSHALIHLDPSALFSVGERPEERPKRST